ncbi:transaldolase [Leucobacter sp. OH2974_COT-288]|nr:transaldolase [Leucobacter sp. OH2974_COT-288]
MTVTPATVALTEARQSLWLDYLSRDFVTSGGLQRAVAEQQVVGVTSNPAIFAQALQHSDTYRDSSSDFANIGVDQRILAAAIIDAKLACAALSEVYEASQYRDGYVSLELDPHLAADTAATVSQAIMVWQQVAMPNLMIKVPATPAGVHAIAELIGMGINVNATLIFSVVRYREVLQAYFAGLETARAKGLELARIRSVASVFVSRFDTAVAAVESVPRDFAIRVGVANAICCYEIWQQHLATARATELLQAGAAPQRLLWASTGVKDASLPPTHYAVQLAIADTVNTLPPATLDALSELDANTVQPPVFDFAASKQVLDRLATYDIDYNELTAALEAQGLQQFLAAWQTLRDLV